MAATAPAMRTLMSRSRRLGGTAQSFGANQFTMPPAGALPTGIRKASPELYEDRMFSRLMLREHEKRERRLAAELLETNKQLFQLQRKMDELENRSTTAPSLEPPSPELNPKLATAEVDFLEEPQYVVSAFAKELCEPPPGLPVTPMTVPLQAPIRPPPGLLPSSHFAAPMSSALNEVRQTVMSAVTADSLKLGLCGTSDILAFQSSASDPHERAAALTHNVQAASTSGSRDLTPPPPSTPPPPPTDVPSVGSVGHHLGLCKPCDFVDRGFCRAGAECKFCHLCGPAERKQRKAQRRKMLRAGGLTKPMSSQ